MYIYTHVYMYPIHELKDEHDIGHGCFISELFCLLSFRTSLP